MTAGEAIRHRVLGCCLAVRPCIAVAPGLLLVQAFLAIACFADDERMYVITSEPNPNRAYNRAPAVLYRVEGEELEKVRTITTALQDTLFVQPYPDQGYVFVGSEGARPGAFLLDVLDLRSLGVERTLDLDGCWGCNAANHRSGCMGCCYATSQLFNQGGRLIYIVQTGTWYSEELDCACRDLGVDVVTGEAVADVSTASLGLSYEYGAPGGLVDGGDFGIPIYADGRQAIVRGKTDARAHRLGWEIPDDMRLGPGPKYPADRAFGDWARLMINNDQMRVLHMLRGGEPSPGADADKRRFHVFDKASWEWRKLELRGSGVPMHAQRGHVHTLDTRGFYLPMRAFREWLAAEEVYRYEPEALDMERLAEHRFAPFSSAAERFEDDQAAPSGRFRLYNVRSKELIVHDTGEPDSEVLYVDEDRFAYFRVSDELRRARIGDGKLGPEEVLVKAPELWAVHWLFFGRE